MTYRIMIVEDEPPSMRSIEHHIVTCGVSDIAVVGKASNGAEALEQIPKVRPHIIFSDVQMPVMDGFTLVEQVRKLHPEILIVILSGYQEFDYVKKALQFKLSDYLLKPIDPTELAAVLEKLKTSLAQSFYQSMAKYLRACIDHYPAEAPPMKMLSYYMVLTINAGLYCESGSRCAVGASLDKARLQTLLAGMATEQYTWILESGSPNRMVAVVGAPTALHSATSVLSGRFQAMPSHPPYTVAYSTVSSPEDISAAIARTNRRVWQSLIPGKAQLLDADAPYSLVMPPAIGQAEGKNLLSLLARSNSPRFFTALTALLEQMIPPGSTQEYCQRVFDSVIILLKTQLSGLDSQSICVLEALPREPFSTYRLSSILKEFAERVQKFLLSCEYVPVGDLSTDAIIGKVASYLRRNYSEDIEFQSLAIKFGISPAYLSTLFKKAYGVTPIKYLLNIRVEKAKELIASDPDIAFRQVAQMVGYADAHYFSRIFRAMTHLTPSAYRASLENAPKEERKP